MKYQLTNQSIIHNGRKLYRIQALKDLKAIGVSSGDLGGFVESEKNLSQEGDCWINGDALVFGQARVYDNSIIDYNAIVCGNANVIGASMVYDSAEVFGNAKIKSSKILSNAQIFGNATIISSKIGFDSKVFGNATIKKGCLLRRSQISTAQVFRDLHLFDVEILNENQCSIVHLEFLDTYLYSYVVLDTLVYMFLRTRYDSDSLKRFIKSTRHLNELEKLKILDIISLNEIKFKAQYSFLS